MKLRDEFAIAALRSLIESKQTQPSVMETVHNAYVYADEMVKQSKCVKPIEHKWGENNG